MLTFEDCLSICVGGGFIWANWDHLTAWSKSSQSTGIQRRGLDKPALSNTPAQAVVVAEMYSINPAIFKIAFRRSFQPRSEGKVMADGHLLNAMALQTPLRAPFDASLIGHVAPSIRIGQSTNLTDDGQVMS